MDKDFLIGVLTLLVFGLIVEFAEAFVFIIILFAIFVALTGG